MHSISLTPFPEGGRLHPLRSAHLEPRLLARTPGAPVLGVVLFGGAKAPGLDVPVLDLPLPVLGDGPPLAEVWFGQCPVTSGRSGDIVFGHDGTLLFAALSLAESGQLEQTSEHAYSELLDFCEALGYPHVLRMWNHFHEINGDEQGLERYRRFNIGRHRALAARLAAGWTRPAASAVGSAAPGFHVYLIAGKQPGHPVENPRQVRAYEYPQDYGPRPPDFSRATSVTLKDHRCLFISGTAAISGHASCHLGDPEGQLQESLRNIEALLGVCGSADLAQLRTVKVYVRGGAGGADLIQQLKRHLPASADALLVGGDICRRELVVEIEAFAVLA